MVRPLEIMRTAPKLTSEEFKRFLSQAVAGEAEAQYVVGGAYFNGNGTQRDLAQGERWLLAAAEQGHTFAQCDLGALYAEGKVAKQSYPDALKWLRKAAEKGDVVAQAGLGSLLAKGFRDKSLGFFQRVAGANASVDRVEPYKWFNLALNGGYSSAARDMKLLRMLMSANEIETSERRVRDFLRHKLHDRPFTERLLTLGRRIKEDLGEAVERTPPETLEAEIEQAIVLVAGEIAMDATSEVFGLGSVTVDPLPPKFYIAGVFALVIVMSLSNRTKQENHKPAQELGFRVISTLLALRQGDEIAALFKKSHWQLTELVKRSDHPKVEQWLDTAMQLAAYYVLDEKTRSEVKEKHLFAEALRTLVDATE